METDEGEKQMKVLISLLILVLLGASNPLLSGNLAATKPIASVETQVSKLTNAELRAMFLLIITSWDDGSKIKIFVLPANHPTQRAFLWDYFGLTPTRYTDQIDNRVLSGRAIAPIVVNTEREMIQKVSRRVGNIGYVGTDVYVGVSDGIKVLSIK
jgi:ABC-type phosphate transport system substrate-binding protein